MLRADMDALPVKELTGLPYASSKTQVDRYGKENPVMHACGHDVHVACLMGAAELLHSAREAWSGTLICLFQPGEEDGAGARKMVADGLLDKIPKPDVLLGQHVVSTEAGTVQIRSGAALSACDCFDIRLFGKGGHGSSPHQCIDPVYAACCIVVRLQGIVSRELDPAAYAVVTCVDIQTSKAINIIPDVVDMKIDVRTYDSAVRQRVVQAVNVLSTARARHPDCQRSRKSSRPTISRQSSTTTGSSKRSRAPSDNISARAQFRKWRGTQRAMTSPFLLTSATSLCILESRRRGSVDVAGRPARRQDR